MIRLIFRRRFTYFDWAFIWLAIWAWNRGNPWWVGVLILVAGAVIGREGEADLARRSPKLPRNSAVDMAIALMIAAKKTELRVHGRDILDARRFTLRRCDDLGTGEVVFALVEETVL